MDSVGRKIRELRKIRKLKQEQLAEHLNISTRHVRNLKSGGTSVSAPLLYKISQEFQKPMEYFLIFREEDESIK